MAVVTKRASIGMKWFGEHKKMDAARAVCARLPVCAFVREFHDSAAQAAAQAIQTASLTAVSATARSVRTISSSLRRTTISEQATERRLRDLAVIRAWRNAYCLRTPPLLLLPQAIENLLPEHDAECTHMKSARVVSSLALSHLLI